MLRGTLTVRSDTDYSVSYEKRDAAWHEHLTKKLDTEPDGWEAARLQAVFNAGWEARKRAELEAMLEGMRRPQRPGDPKQNLYDSTDGRTDR